MLDIAKILTLLFSSLIVASESFNQVPLSTINIINNHMNENTNPYMFVTDCEHVIFEISNRMPADNEIPYILIIKDNFIAVTRNTYKINTDVRLLEDIVFSDRNEKYLNDKPKKNKQTNDLTLNDYLNLYHKTVAYTICYYKCLCELDVCFSFLLKQFYKIKEKSDNLTIELSKEEISTLLLTDNDLTELFINKKKQIFDKIFKVVNQIKQCSENFCLQSTVFNNHIQIKKLNMMNGYLRVLNYDLVLKVKEGLVCLNALTSGDTKRLNYSIIERTKMFLTEDWFEKFKILASSFKL